MMDSKTQIAWKLYEELRKEILESQRIRAQIIGFKITFVSATVGLIVANHDTVPLELLAIPALASIFFDLLVNSNSISIKRNGRYSRKFLEPKLRVYSGWSENEPLWEEFMANPSNRQSLSMIGNLGVTALTLLAAGGGLYPASNKPLSISVAAIIFLFFVYDIWVHLMPGKLAEVE